MNAARRASVLGGETIRALAAAEQVAVRSPLLERGVLAALAGAGGWLGFPTRPNALIRLFGDLLPHDVLSRPTKATFNGVAFGVATRAFAASWDGTGVDPALVDAEALRAEWLSPMPSGTTSLLLHQAWLACTGR
jgi:asparagine synthase (glutamine-hydrolysing)